MWQPIHGRYDTDHDIAASTRRWVDTNVLGQHRPSGLTGVTNMYGVDTGSKTYAGDTYAALTRDQWQTYVSTFVPIENQLIDYATDKNKPLEAMQKASQNVQSAFSMQEAGAASQLRPEQGTGGRRGPERGRRTDASAPAGDPRQPCTPSHDRGYHRRLTWRQDSVSVPRWPAWARIS
jgi:hypothetical protein